MEGVSTLNITYEANKEVITGSSACIGTQIPLQSLGDFQCVESSWTENLALKGSIDHPAMHAVLIYSLQHTMMPDCVQLNRAACSDM